MVIKVRHPPLNPGPSMCEKLLPTFKTSASNFKQQYDIYCYYIIIMSSSAAVHFFLRFNNSPTIPENKL